MRLLMTSVAGPQGNMAWNLCSPAPHHTTLLQGIEKWGGMYALAEELGYAVERAPAGARGATHGAWHEHMRTVAASTGLGGNVVSAWGLVGWALTCF